MTAADRYRPLRHRTSRTKHDIARVRESAASRFVGEGHLPTHTSADDEPGGSAAMTQLIEQTTKHDTASWFHVARHLVEMFLAMMAGMMAGAFLLAAAVGTSIPEARREYAVAWVLVMALDMTVPMVAVMLYRGHSRRSAGEMAAAMIVPALVIVVCQLSHVVGGDVGRAYMPVSMVAMVALIIYRRREYRTAAAGHG